MGLDAFSAEVAAAEGLRGIHGESGFDGLGAGRVHDLRPCLVVEEPGLGLVDGAAVDDGDRQEVVAVVRILNQHELTRCADGELLIGHGLFEVVGECAEKESVLNPGGSMIREFGNIGLTEAFIFVEVSNSFRFLQRVHVQSDEIFGERRNLVDLGPVHDASRNRCIAERFAGRHAAASGDESIASTLAWGYDDRLQEAVCTDALGQLAHAVLGDVLPQGGAVHVDLVDVDVLFHRGFLVLVIFARVVRALQGKSYPQFPPVPPPNPD